MTALKQVPKETGYGKKNDSESESILYDRFRRSQESSEGLLAGNERLGELGYKPELKREFTYFSAFSFAVSVSGLFGTIATTFTYPLMAGDSACVVWAWAIGGVGCLCIAYSVAELVSAYPTSGGLYYACSKVFPKKWAPFMCWVDGWVNLLGQIAGVASSDYGAAQIILAAGQVGTDFKYNPTTNHVVGVMAGILVVQGMISCMPTRYIEKFTKFYVVFHFGALFAGAIALLAKTKPKFDASYVFTHVEQHNNWNPRGFSFLFGFLSVAWTMTDYDATAHICEEMSDPERKAPWAISMAMTFTYVLGFLYNIVLCFAMKLPESLTQGEDSIKYLLNSDQPVVMMYMSLGKGGAVTFAVFMFIVINFLGLSALQAASRTMWAQARDHMYPGSSALLYHVNRLTKTPVNCVVFCTILCIAINLIALGSQETITAIFNVAAIALDWSYCWPIMGKMMFPNLFKPGPWHLGPASFFINFYAVAWTSFVTIIFFFPTERPVTKNNMNYAVVFFVFIITASVVCWFSGGSKVYKGPSATAPKEEDEVRGKTD